MVHNISLPQASLAVRQSTHYSLELLIRRHILSLLKSPICASPLTVEFAVMVKSSSMFLSINVPGGRESLGLGARTLQ
ncbi:hypothetical protein ACLK1T_07045 [Escherichia coli]